MSILEGFIKPETHINPDIDTDIDMSKSTHAVHNTYNAPVVTINIDKLVIADERLASQLMATLVSRTPEQKTEQHSSHEHQP